ncbi:MAG: EAL domain-containing protein [Nocardioides sp.]
MSKASAPSDVFDGLVLALGVAIGVVTAVETVQSGLGNFGTALLSVPLIAIVARFPMLLDRGGGGLEVGFDSSVLMFLLLTVPPHVAMTVWAVAVVVTQLTSGKRLRSKLFNIGVGIVGAAVAAVTVAELRGNAYGAPRELLAVALAAVGYFGVDFVVSAVSVALEQHGSVKEQLAQPGTMLAVACFVPFDCLGYLAAVVSRSTPWWTWGLLAVPLMTLLVATRAVTRGRENARRLSVLFDTAVRMHTAPDETTAESTLLDNARNLLQLRNITLRAAPPGPQEVGAMVQDEARKLWVVAPARQRARSTSAADKEALEAMAAVSSDAFSRLRLTQSMTHLARHDVLTDLANRALLLERTRRALERASLSGGRVAVLFCDLDGFKPINDRFGHAAGDAVLIEVAQRLAANVRRGDTVARLGGDEFAVLLEDVHAVDIEPACDRLLTALRKGVVIDDHHMPLSASVGTAFGDSVSDAEELLRRADLAMYEAKARGKNRHLPYNETLGRSHRHRMELFESLRNAVAADELGVAYQQLVEVGTGRVSGVEALARWTSDGKNVPPDVFIRVAESSGLIVPLGQRVLEQVTSDAPSLKAAAGGDFSVGVNVSAQQLRDPAFVGHVTTAMEQMPGVTLILELTERCVVSDDDATRTAMTTLVDAGALFAIDDFGVGFSSLSYLKHLPVKILKTDASLSSDIDADERSCRLLRSVVAMGDALGLDVIVEGIERHSQLEHLREHVGASFAQGFLMHRPASGESVRRRLLALA